jgi:hypothetical protein
VFSDREDLVRRSCERVRIGEPQPQDDDTEVAE